MKPLALKAGMAVAFSLAGYFASQLHPRQSSSIIAAAPRRRSPLSASSGSSEPESGRKTGGGLKEELRHIKHEDPSSNFACGAIASSFLAFPQKAQTTEKRDLGYLVSEFEELVFREFGTAEVDKEPERATVPSLAQHKVSEDNEESSIKQEISELKNAVRSLEERERKLELQLLEYHTREEQTRTVMELDNRLKVKEVESQLFESRLSSLQADNWRLEAQLCDHSLIVAELESAKEKIGRLKLKLKSQSEQANERVAALQQRVVELEDEEREERERQEEAQQSLKSKIEHLEEKEAHLKEENLRLARENMELTKLLEDSQIPPVTLFATSEEAFIPDEELNSLRQKNEQLIEEIKQLQADRCSDAEQLVYLRWVNACLRYELRNYNPSPGKTAAKDLNKCSSPKSIERAKQLILEYAYSGNDDENGPVAADLTGRGDRASSPESVTAAEANEVDDASSVAKNSTGRSSGRTKLLGKFKKLVSRKDSPSKIAPSSDHKTPASGTSPFEDGKGRVSLSPGSINGSCVRNGSAHGDSSAALAGDDEVRLSPGEARELRAGRCRSDLSTSGGYKRFISSEISVTMDRSRRMAVALSPEIVELKRFAGALK